MAALGLAQVATVTLTWVEIPTLEEHTVTIPVSVNVVPADVAKGRVPAPIVEREKLFLAAQRAKKSAEEALDRGDLAGAGTMLDDAMGAFADASPECAVEPRGRRADLAQHHARHARHARRGVHRSPAQRRPRAQVAVRGPQAGRRDRR